MRLCLQVYACGCMYVYNNSYVSMYVCLWMYVYRFVCVYLSHSHLWLLLSSPSGKAGEMIDRGDNTYGGKYVVNPSGGLISKGHPLGATGLAQCCELSWQLRGVAGRRQVPGARLALQHNIGLGGAVVVSLYRLGFPEQASKGR